MQAARYLTTRHSKYSSHKSFLDLSQNFLPFSVIRVAIIPSSCPHIFQRICLIISYIFLL